MADILRAATRRSPLARWQAERVAALLEAAHPGLRVELVPLETEGDQRLDVPIAEIGGKGVFAKEIQQAVLDGRADIAVHSAKDLTAVTVPGLVLAAVPERGDPRDALVGRALADLPEGATVATGSQRRRAQLKDLRPDLRFVELRGNMAARMGKVPEGGSIVVASVALERLGLGDHIEERFTVEQMIPQVGQGALGIECRSDDDHAIELLRAIEDAASRRQVDTERAFLTELGGDCDLPAGAHAVIDSAEGAIELRGFLAEPAADGTQRLVRASESGSDPDVVGQNLARSLRAALA